MSFTRTPAGLSNQHRFHRVDAVVFVEGGDISYSFNDVVNGYSGTASPDIAFWRKIFDRFAGNLRVVIKPVGSKSTLRQLAAQVATKEINHIFVAMDQDEDRFTGQLVNANGVFYTWGYSWENDVLQKDVIVEVILTLTPVDRMELEQRVQEVCARELAAFQKEVAPFTRVDILFKIRHGALFPSNEYKSLIKSANQHNRPPQLNVSKLKRMLHQKKPWSRRQRPFRLPPSTSVRADRDTFGHLYCTYCYRLLLHICSTYAAVPVMALVNAAALAARVFADSMSVTTMGELHTHYVRQFAFIHE